MSVSQCRRRVIAQLITDSKEILNNDGISRSSLDKIKLLLVDVSRHDALFARENFPAKDDRDNNYRLHEDPDGRFALYASVGKPGVSQPPHNHTTWAVIAGVRGEEHNVFFERVDDRKTSFEGQLKKTGKKTIGPQGAVALLPDDFHTIEVSGKDETLHLHLYGRSLEMLPKRIAFSSEQGGTYKNFAASPDISTPVISARELSTLLRSEQDEIALIDVRSESDYADSHIFTAVSTPLSNIEQRLAKLVPNRLTPVVICDARGELEKQAALKLVQFGYRDIMLLDGGVASWQEGGHEVFSGIHVPSKTFGEFVEREAGTPHITAEELKRLIDDNADVIVLDSRPFPEYQRMSIPGAISCPSQELVYRIQDLVPSKDTLVVVNCAGRTRSIIGAQTLIDTGLENDVVALKNGTMGWHLAGFELQHNQGIRAGTPSKRAVAWGRAVTTDYKRQFGIKKIDKLDQMAKSSNGQSERTVYLLDVRTPEEYESGHLPGSYSAPGVQLIQATDVYVGTRNATLVLLDNDGVRATVAAAWLIRMGWHNVYVYEKGLVTNVLEVGPEAILAYGLPSIHETDGVSASDVQKMLDCGDSKLEIWDLASSREYKLGHIPGASFVKRNTIERHARELDVNSELLLTSSNGVEAQLAAAELTRFQAVRPKNIVGGTNEWRRQAKLLDMSHHKWLDSPDDVWQEPYDRDAGVESAMEQYLEWEVDLIDKLERDPVIRFDMKVG